MEAKQQLADLIAGFQRSRVIHVAAHLGLADLVRGGKDTAEALAEETGLDAWRLGRLMRYLVGLGVFRKTGDRFTVAEIGSFLCSDTPGNILNVAVMNYFTFSSWTALEEGMRQKTPAYELVNGCGHFEDMAAKPEFNAAFDKAMNDMFVPELEAMITEYDFSRHEHILDVGGGNGETLIRIMKAFPNTRGTVFDQPQVVERAAQRILEAGLADRCDCLGGNFFEPLPLKAKTILLRHILHDWPEDKLMMILRNCRDALEPGGTLLIGEANVEDSDTITMPLRLDISMMTYYDGAERTLDEYSALVSSIGMELVKATPITPSMIIMEVKRR